MSGIGGQASSQKADSSVNANGNSVFDLVFIVRGSVSGTVSVFFGRGFVSTTVFGAGL
jgi:hypothetical protein